MRKSAVVALLAVALVLVAAAPSHARRHGFHGHRARVFVGVGPVFWWDPPYPWWYYPPPYYGYPPPYYVYTPPVVVVQEPPVYIQQPPAPPPRSQSYWYYCPSVRGYYPNVQTCPEAWIKVPPRTE